MNNYYNGPLNTWTIWWHFDTNWYQKYSLSWIVFINIKYVLLYYRWHIFCRKFSGDMCLGSEWAQTRHQRIIIWKCSRRSGKTGGIMLAARCQEETFDFRLSGFLTHTRSSIQMHSGQLFSRHVIILCTPIFQYTYHVLHHFFFKQIYFLSTTMKHKQSWDKENELQSVCRFAD